MTKPVIVYGASGYTGRLICEYLREFNLPFVAAGRDKARIAQALDKVPGIDTVEHEIVEVSHDIQPLTELFQGASVVCNTVGPFAQFGREVVEACINAGCHYLDTTGEQDWLITCDEDYGQQMAAKGLLLAPGIAQMYTTGEIAAQLCLEKPGVDTLDILVFWKGMPTIASTRTILVNAALSKAYYLEQNSYVEWPADGGLYDVVIPGQHETGLALPWGGTSHPVWFKRDPRVANVKVLGGVFNRALMLGVPQIVGGGPGADRGPAGKREAPGADRTGGRRHERDAAAGSHPDQHLAGLGARLRPAGPRALRDPRQLQLQADWPAAGLRGVLAAPAAAQARRLRVRLPGLRPPRAARPTAQLRPGHGAEPHRPPLTKKTRKDKAACA